ncbi:hypothetical protein OHV65_06960 [Acinetobacter baumannii]|nr:hypothetical protein [Acinetobacter baumannii]
MSILLVNCRDCSIHNVTTIGGGTGIEVKYSKLINIDKVKVNNTEKGIVINDCYDVKVTNAEINMHNQQYKLQISNLARSIRLIMFT